MGSVLQLSSAALEIAAAAVMAPAARGPRVLTVQAAAAVTHRSNVVLRNALLLLGSSVALETVPVVAMAPAVKAPILLTVLAVAAVTPLSSVVCLRVLEL